MCKKGRKKKTKKFFFQISVVTHSLLKKVFFALGRKHSLQEQV